MSVQGLQNPFERLSVLPTTINWRGAWVETEVYFKNDVAVSPINGSSYILTGTVSVSAGEDPSFSVVWTEFSGLSTGIQSVAGVAPGIDVDNTIPLQPVIINTGVLTVIGGGGAINVDNTDPQNPVVNSTAISNLAQGTGISIGGTITVPVINNAGVLQVLPGNGITVTAPTGNVTVTNNGVISLVAGTGIDIDTTIDPRNPTINNTGVASLVVQTPGLSSTGGLNPTIANTGVLTVAPADSSIIITGTAQNPILQSDTPIISLLSASTNYSGLVPPIQPGTTGNVSLFGVPGNLLSTYMLNGAPNPNGVFMLDLTTISFMFNVAAGNVTVTSSPYSISFADNITAGGPYFYTSATFPANYWLSLGQNYPITAFLGQVYLDVAAARTAGLRVLTAIRVTNGTNAPMVLTSSGGMFAVYYPNGIE
jgi:hypothetical protein